MNTIFISDKIVILISILSTIWFIYFLKFNALDKTKGKVAFLTYCNFIVNLLALYYLQNTFVIEHLLMGIMFTFCIITNIILKKFNLYSEHCKIFFTMFTILIIGLGYNLYSPYYLRQHDSRSFINYENGGHFGYIGYIFFNNRLPIGSPIEKWCFFNPPLFHIISAIFLKVQTLFNGFTIDAIFENLQILSLVYATIFNVYVYKILKKLNIKKSIVYMMAFVGLSPAMVIMSGSINNDMLCYMLSTMAIYYTINWYEDDTLKNLIKIALTISLAMMTKISAALVAVPIAFVFLIKMIKNKENLKKYIINFLIFALIALPIGLWFPIKNLVLYDIPVTYVQSVDESNSANISRFSVFERLIKISKENFDTINVVMEGEKIDYNIFLTTIKSFIVDENIDYENNYFMSCSINIIFVCTILLTVTFIINIIYIIKNYRNINNPWLIFFAGIFMISVISYIKFCFDFPFTFTMNFRYIVLSLISYAIITGTACENNKKIYCVNTSIITVFCIASVILFMNLV